jgi:type VI secretion system protein ImpA
VPVTAAGEGRGLTLADYREAIDLDRLSDPDRRAQRLAQGAVSLQVFERAVQATPAELFRNVLEDLAQCAEEFDKLSALLEEKCGRGPDGYPLAPPSSSIRNALATAREELQQISKPVLAAAGLEQAGDGQSGGAMVAAGPQGRLAASHVQTREEAFRALLQVAEFFKRTEPHSPVAYALEQAVRWGRMPLPELLTELLPEAAVREQLFKLVGIKPPEPRGEGRASETAAGR